MAGPLQRPQHHELQQVPDVQARRGRVEAAVVGDRPLGEGGAQRVLVGALGDQPAAVQLVDHVFASRGTILPGASAARLAPRPEHADRRRIRSSQNRHGRSVATADPDPRAGRDRRRRRAAVQPDRRRRRRAGRCRGRRGRSPAPGSAGPVRGPGRGATRAAGRRRAGQLLPHDDLAGAQQHRRRRPPRRPTTTFAHQCTP